MNSGVLPAYGLFLDDAGSLDFSAPLGEKAIKPLVYCAALLPMAHRDALLELIPRSNDRQRRIKSNDREMTEVKAAEFVRRLFQMDVYCGFVYVLASDANTLEIAKHAEEATNARRKSEGKRRLKAPTVLYYLCVSDAIAKAASAYSLVHRRNLNCADLAFDSASLPKALYREMKSNLRSSFAKHLELEIRSIEWRDEESEPLLLIPDQLAGLVHHRATTGGCFDAYAMIEAQQKLHRVQIQDGRTFYSLPARADGPPPA